MENLNPIINSFPGYEYKLGTDGKYHNMYRGTDVGFGGYVYGMPGMYTDIALLDVESMHPHSAIALNAFGDYTKNFKELLEARLAIKHKDIDLAKTLLDGRLEAYLNDEKMLDALPQALKIAINSVYGLTAANFQNAFRDPRNKNNIVALRGALFMRTLQDEVQKKGFIVASIRTDSIKIPNATPDIISYVKDFGQQYGYTFAHEATYERMCLVNNAAYIARYASIDHCEKLYGSEYVNESSETLKDNKKHPNEWSATAKEFQIPYVFKKLFTHEEIEFNDLCETKSVKDALYLDMNEKLPDDTELQKRKKKLEKKLKDMNTDSMLNTEAIEYEAIVKELDEIEDDISKCHNYHFVGKVGSFCPMQSGVGAGELVRRQVLKGITSYPSAEGCKGYRWMESEMVKNLGLENQVDLSYWNKLVDDAQHDISEYGDFEWFTEGDIEDAENHIIPF